jgi:TonB family protein
MQTGQAGGNANMRSLAAERRMQEFAAQTGGAVYSPLAVGDLDAAFSQISADLAQQYILSYYPVDEKQDGRFRAISLRVLSHPNARVRARKGYYASRAGMKSSINWQTDTSVGTTVAGINASDTVPKDASASSETNSISSNTSTLSPATEIKVVSSVPPASSSPSGDTPPASDSPPETKSQAASQTPQPTRSPNVQPSQAAPSENSTPQPAPPASQVSGGVLNGRALSLPKPDYPATARAAGASGVVIVEVTVDESGKVIAARAVSGHPMLRGSALTAARQARFAPTKLSGQPVKVTGTINYNFALAR